MLVASAAPCTPPSPAPSVAVPLPAAPLRSLPGLGFTWHGVNGKPGASLRAWREYFPQAQIYGADIDRDILFAEDRIQTFWTDQRDPKAIRELWHQLDGVSFDVMIDDGLHEAPANICFFMESFHKLKPGGIYVIEDILPHDIDVMNALARSLSCACSSDSDSIPCATNDSAAIAQAKAAPRGTAIREPPI
jgi:hypothetical protein